MRRPMTGQFAVKELNLPPISRGAPISEAWPARALAGPWLHADRLIDLWQVADDEDVPLAQAFRLLDIEAVHGAILRTLGANDYPASDPRYWFLPPLEDLLPELHELSWQAMLAEEFEVEAIKGLHGTRPRTVLSVELPRLTPDWELSRLCRNGEDKFIHVRVRRRPAEPGPKKAWRQPISKTDLKAATEAIVQACEPGAQLSESDFWDKLKERTGRSDLPRQDARTALNEYAPQLKIQPGYHSVKSD
jgi:hypothetical protein